jgi:tRNA modification GTPase
MLTDTIAAIATPPGRSGLAVIRVSGAAAHAAVARVIPTFTPDPLRAARLAHARDPETGETLDEVVYLVYRGPASYTGEDMVELSVHGGLLLPGEVLGAVLASGARPALPGEFTRRAVLNGKLDLLQAEAVADLVDATAPRQRRAAIEQLDRGLSKRIDDLRARVLELEALIAYDIDFPEEDDGAIAPQQVDAAVTDLLRLLTALLGTATEGERLRDGALAVIAGRPNTGKSSLFNALLGRDRAIVTDIPGTTRDAIEAPAICGGFPFRLVDTAGLRSSDDTVERLGVEVSHRYLDAADVVVFCVEADRSPDDDEQAFVDGLPVPVLVARTKADLGVAGDGLGATTVSTVTGQGVPELRNALAAQAFAGLASDEDLGPVVTRARHRSALQHATAEIERFRDARIAGVEAVAAASHLHAAVTALEGLIGAVTTDDVLDQVFGTFCVGK